MEYNCVSICYMIVTPEFLFDECKTIEEAKKIASDYIDENGTNDVVIKEIRNYTPCVTGVC